MTPEFAPPSGAPEAVVSNASADETLQRANIIGERGLDVTEALATSRAHMFDETAGDLIPGAAMLVNRARRIVVVTDRHVYLFRGRRFDRPRECLAAFEIGPQVMFFDGDRILFPDGQTVYVTEVQAKGMARAAGVDIYASLAARILEAAGIAGERARTVARGTLPKPKKNTVGAKAFEFTFGGGDLDLRELHQHLLMLVTDQHVYVLERRGMYESGRVLAVYPVGPGVLTLGSGDSSFEHRITFRAVDSSTSAARMLNGS